jgi:hypothetical protein
MVAILPALATGALSAAGGFAASNILGGLFGGGGGSSGGGGGGIDFDALQDIIAPPDFLSSYAENQFNVKPRLGPKDLEKYEKAMDKGKIDKYSLLGLYDSGGLDPSDKAYRNILTSTIGRPRGEELADVIGKSMFGGGTPSREQVKDAYKYALVTGSTGSPKDAQQAFASYFAQTPEGMKNRMPSSQELLAGMRYGPLVGTESGVKLFAGTPGMDRMFDRQESARRFRANSFA